MTNQIIVALDTSDLDEALQLTESLSEHVCAFKVGHALTLPHGLRVLNQLREAGADRIFLDLKFHDIPNSVALAVREATERGVWMMTLHTVGGPAMMVAAVEEAHIPDEPEEPLLVGVSVLTSLDEHVLQDHLGVKRSLPEQMSYMSKLAVECGLDGVVCSPQEVKMVRETIGKGVIVVPGVRLHKAGINDHQRTGTPRQALEDGADYLVVGRAITSASSPADAAKAILDDCSLAQRPGLA